ncbi:hypothetical protein pb186bvf_017050 [Paramecium bursaria]
MAEEIVDLGSNLGFEVHIHPLAILQIQDLYYRKSGNPKQGQTIVVGSMLGTVFTNRVHITNVFAVSVDEDEDLTIDLQEHRLLYQSSLASNNNEVLLGAFITSKNMDLDISVAYLSTEYIKKDNGFTASAVLGQPIILKINPTFDPIPFEMRAYKLNQNLKQYGLVASFNTLPIKVQFLDESIQQITPFLPANLKQKDFKIVDTNNPQNAIQGHQKNLEKLLNQVDQIINGSAENDQEQGRKLLKILNQINLDSDKNILFQQLEEAQLYQFISNVTYGQSVVNEELLKL